MMRKSRGLQRVYRKNALFGAFVLLACGGDADLIRVDRTDSAGVSIVTSLPGSLESAAIWTLSSEPVLEIGGGVDPGVPLLRVTDVAPRPDGAAIVGLNAPPQVFLFDSAGEILARVGAPGDGPGEFSSVMSVVWLPRDSIAVWDPDRRILSVFDPRGRFVRGVDLSPVVPIAASEAVGTDSTSGFARLLSGNGGTLVVFGEGAVASAPGPTVLRPAMRTYRIRTDGTVVARIDSIPGMEILAGSRHSPMPVPFGARTYAASREESLVIGTAAEPEVRVYDPGGTLTRIVRWADSPRDITGPPLARWSDFVEEWAGSSPPLRELVESVPAAERLPAYQDLLASEQGELMVGEYPGPLGVWPMRRGDHGPDLLRPMVRIPAREWMVFDTTGELTGRFSTPEGFEPYAESGGRLWGVYTDELDVESVRAYALIRP